MVLIMCILRTPQSYLIVFAVLVIGCGQTTPPEPIQTPQESRSAETWQIKTSSDTSAIQFPKEEWLPKGQWDGKSKLTKDGKEYGSILLTFERSEHAISVQGVVTAMFDGGRVEGIFAVPGHFGTESPQLFTTLLEARKINQVKDEAYKIWIFGRFSEQNQISGQIRSGYKNLAYDFTVNLSPL